MVESENELPYCLYLLVCTAVVCHLFLYSFIQYVHQQMHSLDCQKFVHTTYLGTSPGAGFRFGKETYNFQIVWEYNLYRCVHTEKSLIRFTPLHFSLDLSSIQNLKKAMNMSPGIYSIISSFRNYASSSLQVPSILSVLLRAVTLLDV